MKELRTKFLFCRLNPVVLIRSISVFLLLFQGVFAFGQKQLVVTKREDVLLRLHVGDAFVYKAKDSKRRHDTYVRALADTAVVTHMDTIPFHRIERIYFRQHKFYNTVGAALVIFGGGLFLIDQLNEVVIRGGKPNLDERTTRLSLGALAVGLPMMLLKKKSQRIRYPVRLMTVDRGSIFYLPDKRTRIE